MPPKAKQKAVRQIPALSTRASRKEAAEKDGHTWLEIEAASNRSAKRGRRRCDGKAAVLKISNDHVKSLTVDEKFVTKVESLSLEEKIDFDGGRWLKGDVTMGKNDYADLRRLYSDEETPGRSIKVINADESDDEDLENALCQSASQLTDGVRLWSSTPSTVEELGESLVGRSALLYMFALVNEKSDKTFEDLKPFARFAWLLNE